MPFLSRRPLSRRAFLRCAGVTLTLPWLDAMQPALAATPAPPRRMINVLNYFSFHAPNLFPRDVGRDYAPSPYLEIIAEHLRDMTIISGLNHAEVRDNHASDRSFFTGAPHPSSASFRNTISIDQLAAEHLGDQTRHAFLNFCTDTRQTPVTYNARGSALPAEDSPSRVFAKLFIAGAPAEIQAEMERIKEGQSILDRLTEQARKLAREVGPADRDKLDLYFTSVRELEHRMARAEDWTKQPKPRTEIAELKDPPQGEDTTRFGLMLDVARLAIQADLTRVVTIYYCGTAKTPSKPGETFAHHTLSHHGQDENKIKDLAILERDLLREWGRFLAKLKQPTEAGVRLLDSSMALLGSAMGNASSHDATNLPILLAGGPFKHGQHIAHDPQDPPPLCNLWVQMLQQMGLGLEKFATSNGTHIPGLETA